MDPWQAFLSEVYSIRSNAPGTESRPHFYPPVSLQEFQSAESLLKQELPMELAELLRETNGVMEEVSVDGSPFSTTCGSPGPSNRCSRKIDHFEVRMLLRTPKHLRKTSSSSQQLAWTESFLGSMLMAKSLLGRQCARSSGVWQTRCATFLGAGCVARSRSKRPEPICELFFKITLLSERRRSIFLGKSNCLSS